MYTFRNKRSFYRNLYYLIIYLLYFFLNLENTHLKHEMWSTLRFLFVRSKSIFPLYLLGSNQLLLKILEIPLNVDFVNRIFHKLKMFHFHLYFYKLKIRKLFGAFMDGQTPRAAITEEGETLKKNENALTFYESSLKYIPSK